MTLSSAIMLALSAVVPSPIARWEPDIAAAAARFGLPAEWIRRVMIVESGGRPTSRGRPIRSAAGAMGLMQLMPGTWHSQRIAYGLGSDPDHPRDNILAGTAYLRAMYDRFGYPGLFAAYNAGPGRYAHHLRTGYPLPAETRNYLRLVTGRAGSPRLARSPQSTPWSGAVPVGLVRSRSSILTTAEKSMTGGSSVLIAGTTRRSGLFVPLRSRINPDEQAR